MPRSILTVTVSAACALVLSVTPASARITDAWPLVGFGRAERCEVSLRGDGKTVLIAASGLVPGERLDLTLTNADMKPIAWTVLANRDGSWSQYYKPFLWGRPGGTMAVVLSGAGCDVAASAPWQREVRVIP